MRLNSLLMLFGDSGAMPPIVQPLKPPPVAVSLIAFALLTWWAWPLYTVDMSTFLLPWLAHITSTGPIAAFATPFSNYTPPYLYLLAATSPLVAVMKPAALIKLVSVLCNLVLAGAVRHLLIRLEAPYPNRGAALSLIVPSILANAALLHQCDALWSAAMLMALAAAVDRRHLAMFAWCGIGVAFKAQAALVGPFFLALALARGVPFRLWLAAPIAAVLPMVPAILAGWPVANLATIYLRQTEYSDALSLHAPNVWAIVQMIAGPYATQFGGLAFACAVGASGWYVVTVSKRLRNATPGELIAAAALATMLTVGLLPRMHERYFFLADVLTAVLALTGGTPRRIGIYAQVGSCGALLAYMATVPVLSHGMMLVASLAMMVSTWLVLRPFLASPVNDGLRSHRSRVVGQPV